MFLISYWTEIILYFWVTTSHPVCHLPTSRLCLLLDDARPANGTTSGYLQERCALEKYNVKIRNLVCINKRLIAPPATMMRSDKIAGRVKHSQHSSFKHVQDSLQSVCTAQFNLTMEDCWSSAGTLLEPD